MTLEQARGSRVVCGARSGVVLGDRAEIPSMPVQAGALCRAQRVPGSAGGLVVVGWGEASTREAVECAAAQAAAGFRPWVCMRCDGPICRACGSPLTVATGRDVLEDDGGIVHVPVVAAFKARCSNPDCDVRPPWPRKVIG